MNRETRYVYVEFVVEAQGDEDDELNEDALSQVEDALKGATMLDHNILEVTD